MAKTQQAQAVVAAIFLLAIGQLSVIGLGWARGLTLQDAIRSIARERRAADEKYNKSFVAAKLFENEIADLKRRMGLSEKEIQEEMAALRAQFSELAERVARKILPRAPANMDLSALFTAMFPNPSDAEWLLRLDAADNTLGQFN